MTRSPIDSSVLVPAFRDKSRLNTERLVSEIGGDEIVLTRVMFAELLAGAKDQTEWQQIETYCLSKTVVEEDAAVWIAAAQIFFDARRQGKTVRKLTDCAIAHLAIINDATLIHNDRDFDLIAAVRPLKQVRLELTKAKP